MRRIMDAKRNKTTARTPSATTMKTLDKIECDRNVTGEKFV